VPIGRLTADGLTVLIVGMVCVISITYVARQELSFDGALNMQVSQNLLRNGRYATSYPEPRDFHPAIQTGPTVLLPAALCFAMFGESSATAQLPNALYMAAAVVLVAALGRRWTNRWYAILFPLLFLATPDLFDYGLRGYGEIPALAYFLLGLVLYDRLEAGHRSSLWLGAACGLAWGLAYLTKTVMLIAAPAIFCTALLDLTARRRVSWKAYAIMFLAAVAAVGLFEAYKFVQLGARYTGWWHHEAGAIMLHAGVSTGMNDTAGLLPKIRTHLAELAVITAMPLHVLLPLLVLPYGLALAVIFAARFERRIPLSNGMLIVLLTAGTYFAWWLALTPTSRAWSRRILDGWILHELGLLTVLCVAIREHAAVLRTRNRLVLNGIAPWIMLAVLVTAAAGVHLLGVRLLKVRCADAGADPQRALAEVVRQLPDQATIYGLGWWQAPVIAFLSGRSMRDIETQAPDDSDPAADRFLVVDHDAHRYIGERVQELLDRSEHHLVARAGQNALYGIGRLYRFPWFPQPGPEDRILAGVDFSQGRYPHVRGFRADEHGYMWGRPGASVLLAYAGQTRLKVSLWIPPLAGYRSPDLTMTVVLDQVPFVQRPIEADGVYVAEFDIPPDMRNVHGPRAVAVTLNHAGYRPSPDAARVSWIFVVTEIAFKE